MTAAIKSLGDLKPKTTITPAQITLLRRFDSRGLLVLGTDPYRNKRRLMERMVKDGYATHYRHGGYEITDAGRAVIAGAP